MIQWNKIVGYDKQKDYRWQDEKVILPELKQESLFFCQNYQNPTRRPFVGYVKINSYGEPKVYESILDGEIFNIEDGVQWAGFNQPK